MEKACGYKGTESIAFSDFDWPGLNGYSKCEVFFWGLMTAIYGQLCKRRINLTKVAICCERENSYFEFTEKLREISDSYVRAGIVAVWKNIEKLIYTDKSFNNKFINFVKKILATFIKSDKII